MTLPIKPKPEIKWAYDQQILIKKNVLTADDCQNIIEQFRDRVRPTENKYARYFSTDFNTALIAENHWVYNKIAPTLLEINDFFKFSVDFIEPLEIKEYQTNGHFGLHKDNYFGLESGLDRKITVSCQLSKSQDYTGGQLKIMKIPIKIDQGDLVAFPSFLSHEVTPVTKGSRHVLVGWIWGANWK